MPVNPYLQCRALRRAAVRLSAAAITGAAVIGTLAGVAGAASATAPAPVPASAGTATNHTSTPVKPLRAASALNVGPVYLASSEGTTLALGGTTTLTATTQLDVGPTPFYIQIYDATTGTRLAACGDGNSCTAVVSQSVATTQRYIAYVSEYSTAFPPPSVQDTSGTLFQTWTTGAWRISLSALESGGHFTVTANTNLDVGPSPYYIEIFNENGTLLQRCGSGERCSLSLPLPSGSGGEYLVAFVSAASATFPPASIQASSNAIVL